jgi:hypothetical protein
MIATDLDIDFEREIAGFNARRVRGREKGEYHLSEIIHWMVEKLDPGRFGDSGPDPLTASLGFMWEDVFGHAFGKAWRLGSTQIQTELDGVLMTLDGFDVRRKRVRDFKFTKMSAATPITGSKCWHWKMQVNGYCRAFEVREAELIVMHINGAYELGGGRFGKPVAKGHLLQFTEMESRELWEAVLRARDSMRKEPR